MLSGFIQATNLDGKVIAVANDLSNQVVSFNYTSAVAQQPTQYSHSQPYLPLPQPNPHSDISILSNKNVTLMVNNATLLIVNTSTPITQYKAVPLSCPPEYQLMVAATSVYFLCPVSDFVSFFLITVLKFNLESLQNSTIREDLDVQPNLNGILVKGPAPNYDVYYVTAIGNNLMVINLRTGTTLPVSTPHVCTYINGIKSVSESTFCIMCAATLVDNATISNVHFKNLTSSNYVSIQLSRGIPIDDLIVTSAGFLAVLANSDHIILINWSNGEHRILDTGQQYKLADIALVNKTLAYYVTKQAQLFRFSPQNQFDKFPTSPIFVQPACPPPNCPLLTSISKTHLLFSIKSSLGVVSLAVHDGYEVVISSTLGISPIHYIVNLSVIYDSSSSIPSSIPPSISPSIPSSTSPSTSRPTTSTTGSKPTEQEAKKDNMKWLWTLGVIVIFLLVISPIIIITCIFIRKKSLKHSIEETQISDQEQCPYPCQASDSSSTSSTERPPITETTACPINESTKF